jgi:dTDP-glucose 4,6-dehydratase
MPYTVYLDHHRTSSYVTDTCQTLANIVDRFRPGEVYNIGGTEYHDIKSVSDLILRCLGKSDALVEYKSAEPFTTRDKRVSMEKAVQDLGHNPVVTLDIGIQRTIEWMKAVYVDRRNVVQLAAFL